MPVVLIRTLGPLQLTIDGAPPPRDLTWTKPLALLLYLARSPRHTRTREHLVGLLWPDKPGAVARHSLDVEVARLRKHLGASIIESRGEQLKLDGAGVQLDLDYVETAPGMKAADLILGEFAEGFHVDGASAFEDWLAAERAQWRNRGIQVLADASVTRLTAGDTASAIALARRAVSLDQASERSVHALMQALAVADDRSGALHAWRLYSERVTKEGVQPSRGLASLADRIRAEHAPSRTDGKGPVMRRIPLIGRNQQVATLMKGWHEARAGHTACLVIVGDAGTGRTRLADELSLRARLDGAATFLVRAVPDDRTRPWSGWQALAESGLAQASGVAAASPRALATMTRVSERWRERFPHVGSTVEPLDRRSALEDVLAAAAGEQPVLVVIDDAQWIDGESLESLEAALRLASVPMALLLTMTPLPQRNDLDTIRARIGRDLAGASVSLAPFEGQEIQEIVGWAFPNLAATDQERVARRVFADSAGLPLLAVELLHAASLGLEIMPRDDVWLAQGRTLDQTLPGDLPDSIVAAARIGFSFCSPDARLVLEALAIMPGRQPASVLATMADVPETSAIAALDELEFARWVNSDARGYAYLANVIRLVIERDMVTRGKRRRMLARLGIEPG